MTGLGRLPSVVDHRDQLFRAVQVLSGPAVPESERKSWRTGPVLDQGQTPQCVGFGSRGWYAAAPRLHRSGHIGPTAEAIYHAAQLVDGWPLPHDGSSVRAGLQALQGFGLVDSYWWIDDVHGLIQWLLRQSPVILGTNWHEDMFDPEPSGLVRVTGPIVGGHCFIAYGWDGQHGIVKCLNSWGAGWGVLGRFAIAAEDMDALIKADGEAVGCVERAR